MLNWNEIDHVFLDMDGTLLDLHFDNFFWLEYLPKRYADIHGKPADAAKTMLHGLFAEKRGTLDWYCLAYWQTELAVDILSLKQEVAQKIQFRDGAEAFIQRLQCMGKHVALVSNAHPWSIQLKTDRVLAPALFDAIHSSHDFGYPKERTEFWEAFCSAYPFDRSRALFVDDNEQVLESARAFGIEHLWSISQPDSQKGPQPLGSFPQISEFGALFE